MVLWPEGFIIEASDEGSKELPGYVGRFSLISRGTIPETLQSGVRRAMKCLVGSLSRER